MSREAQSRAAKPRETKRRQPLPERAFHRAGSAVAFTAANAAAETGTDERPLIAVSAGSFNTTPPEEGNQNKKELLMKAFSFLLACCAAFLAAGSASASDASPDADMALQLRRILKEHPDIVLDVLREHSETALDIVQLGADRRRAEALHNQWTEDARQPKKASLEERPSRGPADAPVTLIAFSDFTCAYCQQAAFAVESLLKRYPDDVRFVFKQSPNSETGILAGRWFVAAARQDMKKAWDFYALLFDAQRKLIDSPLPTLRETAGKAGLDVKKLEADLRKNSQAIDLIVATDIKEAKELGFAGTPYFLVNNLVVRGAVPLETFIDAVEFARAGKR